MEPFTPCPAVTSKWSAISPATGRRSTCKSPWPTRADSDRVIALLKQVGDDFAHDPGFSNMIVASPDVPGIDKVSGNAVDYLMLVKTKPGSQFAVKRELQRRIKAALEKNQIEPGDPSRVIVAGIVKPS